MEKSTPPFFLGSTDGWDRISVRARRGIFFEVTFFGVLKEVGLPENHGRIIVSTLSVCAIGSC